MSRTLTTLVFCSVLSFGLSAQPCMTPPFQMPGESCPQATSICTSLSNYCGILPFDGSSQVFAGCPANVLNNDEWIAFVAGSSSISMIIFPENCQGVFGQFGMQAAIYEGSCTGPVVATQCECAVDPFLLSYTNFIPGQTYYLVLDGCLGDICEYFIEIIDGSTSPTLPETPSINGPVNICVGSTVEYEAISTGNSNYSWSVTPGTGNNFVTSGNNRILFYPNAPDTYEICVTALNACGASDPVCQNVVATLTSQEIIDTLLCVGDCLSFNGTDFCQPGNYILSLTNAAGCDSLIYLTVNQFFSPPTVLSTSMPCEGFFVFRNDTLTEIGVFEFVDTNVFGCDSIIYVQLTGEFIDASAGSDRDFGCTFQDSIQLQGVVNFTLNGGYEVNWTTTDGHFISGSDQLNPLVDQPGTYCMTIVEDSLGCQLTDCVVIGANAQPPQFELKTIGELCEPGQTVQICHTGASDNESEFIWSTPDGNIVGPSGLKCITANQQGTYCLQFTDKNGCDSSACIAVDYGLNVTIDGPMNTCAGADETFSVTVEANDSDGALLFWQVGNVSFASTQVSDFPFQITDWFFFSETTTITAWAIDVNGCRSDTVVFVVENNVPDPTFEVVQSNCGEATINVNYPLQVVAYEWVNGSTASSITVTQNGTYWVRITDENGCQVTASIFVEIDFPASCSYLQGTVSEDLFDNCLPDLNEMPLAGWTVQASGGGLNYFATTAADGSFFIPVEPGDYNLQVFLPVNLWEICQNNIPVSVPNPGDVQSIDFLLRKLGECPLLTVDISSSVIRICRENIYAVKYCNLGTQTATDAYIDITVDVLMSFQSATIPFTNLGNNLIRFQVGDVQPGECGNFIFRTDTDCNAPLGFNHCNMAHIFPDTACIPPNPMWSGAVLETEGRCFGATRFTIKNAGTGAMAEPLTYTVFRNSSIYLFQQLPPLAAGETKEIFLPADTATWRLEVSQDPFYPYSSLVVSSVQGCTPTGLSESVTSYINNMVLADQDQFLDVDCRPNIGSFDPNVKEGSPYGYGAERFIPDGTGIEYQIRFQNTGSDTAFSVVLRDTLSNLLDISTLQMGASSHDYTYELIGQGVLKVDFPGIALPHQDVDELGSIGFIEFKIAARQGLPPLTRIENNASIYFDFNEPIRTNTTFHTIEKPVVNSFQKIEICPGEMWGGQPFFSDTIISTVMIFPAYDSIAWTEIGMASSVDSTVFFNICANQEVVFNGINYGPGTHVQTVSAVNGCDSIFTIIVEELPVQTFQFTAEFCGGETYFFNGTVLDSPGSYEATLTSSAGCDSVVLLELVAVSSYDIFQSAEICEGDTFLFNGQSLTEEGHYEASLTSSGGCDSLVTLSLSVRPVYGNVRAATICHGDSAQFNGQFFDQTGWYSFDFTSVHGCDSTETFDLTVLDNIGSDFSATICEGEDFDFAGEILTLPGTYQAVFTSVQGCDSTVTLFLEVEPVFADTNELVLVSGELFQGFPIFNDTTITETFVAQNGCDSLVTTHITVMPNSLRENVAAAIGLVIYPSPADSRFFVKFNLPGRQEVVLKIINMVGQQVVFASQKDDFPAGEHIMEINASDWPSGVYLVHFQMDSGVATGRVVVE